MSNPETDSDSKIDEELWNEVLKLAKGSTEDQVKAVNLIVENRTKLPKHYTDIIIKLASKDSELDVRMKIAQILSEGRFPMFLHSLLMKVLSEDPSDEIKKMINKIREKEMEQLKGMTYGIRDIMAQYSAVQNAWRETVGKIFEHWAAGTILQQNLEAWKQMTQPLAAYQEQLRKIAEQYSPIRQMLEENQKRISEMTKPWNEVFKIQGEIAKKFSARDVLPVFAAIDTINKTMLRSLPLLSQGYYPEAVLEQLREVPAEAKETYGKELSNKLKKVECGSGGWNQYQVVCKEILSYTLVPPLLDPQEEVYNEQGTQRRDLLFPIPNDVTGFWNFIKLTHESLSIIVDTKNYCDELPPNQMVIASKYFGKKRLGMFGIIVTRKGLSEGARTEQRRFWMEEDKLILCLTDEDLLKMIRLKEDDDDPAKVIDDHYRKFRTSL